MTDLDKKDLPLPVQEEGEQKDFKDSRTFATLDDAHAFYSEASARLLDVNNWDKLCGTASATFELTDSRGVRTFDRPQPGFHFKIDIPGPGGVSGDGFDWVRVEQLSEDGDAESDTQYIRILVRPATDPTNESPDVAHFFSDKATSTFLVMREGNEITAAVLGRNEIENTEKNEHLVDKIRNFIVGATAKMGIADPQWKQLVAGILDKR